MLRGRKAQNNPVSALEASGAIVAIDQEPLRENVASACARTLARLELARAGWHRFERQDKPAFIRWRAREFGALLSTARETETRIRDLQALVHEVEMELRRGFFDAFSAYERVMVRRANRAVANEAETPEPNNHGPRKLSDFEKEALFQDWVRRSLGTHPDKMDDAAYARSFEAFKTHMFRAAPEEPSPNEHRPRPTWRGNEAEDENEAEPETATVDTRVKALYRRLVRRLHPDLKADGNAAVSALWHEVQGAYAANDVAQLEILLALSDMEARRTNDQSLAQMHAVREELERSLRALEKRLFEARSEDAWDFARFGPHSDLRRRVEGQLRSDLARRSLRLDLLTRTVAEWAAGPVPNSRVSFA